MQNTTLALLDRYKASCGFRSDNEAAIALGIERATVSGWRHGKSHAAPESAAKMAQTLSIDVLAVLASIEADRARTPEARRIWARFGKGAFMALLLGFPMAGSTTGTVPQAEQSPLSLTDRPIMRSRRRRPRRIVRTNCQPHQKRFSWG